MKTILIASILTCVAHAEEKPPTWHESMRDMAITLTELIPDLTKPEVFVTPDEKTQIIKKSKSFLKFAHSVKGDPNPPTHDPIVPMISNSLKSDIESAVGKMEAGRWSLGTRQMLNLTSNCIACHTLSQGPATAIINAKLEHFSRLQKANFYAATRQFDRAVINYEYVLTDTKWAKDRESEWNDAFQKLLGITVRVRNNPNLTLELISRFFDTKTYPKGLSAAAKVWRAHAKEWGKEKNAKNDLSEAKLLIERANKLQSSSSAPVSLVLYLRASSILHGILSQTDQTKNQEALLLAGQSAEGLSDQNLWAYSGFYFRQCLSIDPKTKLGRACTEELKKLN